VLTGIPTPEQAVFEFRFRLEVELTGVNIVQLQIDAKLSITADMKGYSQSSVWPPH
jgi:hypothetical protein